MASTRRKGVAKVEIYQDPEHSLEEQELARTLQMYNNALQPAKDDVTNTDIILGPPHAQISVSPTKRSSPQSSPHIEVDQSIFDSVIFPPPEGFFPTDSPTKKSNYGPFFAPIAQKPQKGLFTTFSSSTPSQSRNRRLSIPAVPSFGASDSLYASLANTNKRPAAEPIYLERPGKRGKPHDDCVGPLPAPEDLPVIPDEDGKPNYSYAQLIGMAILRAPERKMTLSQIYKWISDTFSFYRDCQAGSGWQNSIRHNLSLNKAFVKKERPKEDPGKGNYWAIQDGFESQFFKDRSFRRSNHVDQASFEPSQIDTCPLPSAPPYGQSSNAHKNTVHVDSSTFPNESNSSDATLPMSDQVNEPVQDEFQPQVRVPSPPTASLSSPPLDLNSSPPIPRHAPQLNSPSHGKRLSISRSGGRKKHFDNFRDSGFFSSIESSVPRNQVASMPPSDAGHRSSTLKRGRAEEEIARMRGSSFDPSPTKGRQALKKAKVDASSKSSSPPQGSSIGFPPLTPGLKLHPPTKGPSTISPGTHLRRHRESIRDLVGTPAARENASAEATKLTPSLIFANGDTFSPQFTPLRSIAKASPPKIISPLKDTQLSKIPSPENPQEFDFTAFVSEDSDENNDQSIFSNVFRDGSPIAKKLQRPINHRAHVSTSALQDITNARQSKRLGSPIRLSPPKTGAVGHHSPAKKLELPKNDVFLGAHDSSEDENHYDTFDLAKGFNTIGTSIDKENAPLQTGSINKGVAKTKANRAPLGRSSTNLI